MIRARHDSTIDWHETAGLFDRGGAGDMFSSLSRVRGSPVRTAHAGRRRSPPADAVERLRQAIEHPEALRRVMLADLIEAYAARLRAKPHVVVNLLSPRLWPRGFAGQERPQAFQW